MPFKSSPQMFSRSAIAAVQHWLCEASIDWDHRLTASARGLLAGIAILAWCGTAVSDDWVGQASVIDGDTLEIHGIHIRLWGIDAPESSQLCRGEDSLQYRCGAQAANELGRRFYLATASELPSDQPRSLWTDGCNLRSWWRRSRGVAGEEWSRPGLAGLLERQVRCRPA
jgi:hypothetical protein